MVSVSLMIVALNASANFGSGPWSNNGWNNGGNSNNGFIAHNPHSMFTPDWFSEEMDDMMTTTSIIKDYGVIITAQCKIVTGIKVRGAIHSLLTSEIILLDL